eukprot:UN03450
MRDIKLLNVLKELLLFIKRVDPKPNKDVSAGGVKYLLMDIPYWARCEKSVKLRLFELIRTLLETDEKIIRDAVGVHGLQDAIKMIFPNAVPSELIRNPKNHTDSDIDVL